MVACEEEGRGACQECAGPKANQNSLDHRSTGAEKRAGAWDKRPARAEVIEKQRRVGVKTRSGMKHKERREQCKGNRYDAAAPRDCRSYSGTCRQEATMGQALL